MQNKNNIARKIKDGLIASIPVAIGYFPVAMGFGLIAKNMSLSFSDTSLMSIMVYAGAAQFMALDLIRAGVSYAGIILATFLLNLRHMMMSASLAVEFKNIPKKFLPLIGFGITDEAFSVISFNKDKIDLVFVSTVVLISYGSWIAGTLVGFAIGEILPKSLQSSLSIGLYAMFAALLFPEIKKSNKTLILGLMAAGIYAVLYYLNLFASGWDIILAIIISSALGVTILDKKGGEIVD